MVGRSEGKTILATGVFDLIHPGHLRFLEESRKLGGPDAKLIVVVARDRTVLTRKGRPPVLPETQRRQIVASLKPVSKAILGHEELDLLGILREYKPDIVCVGYDQNEIKASVEKLITAKHLPIKVVQIGHYGPRGLDSSTLIKNRAAGRS